MTDAQILSAMLAGLRSDTATERQRIESDHTARRMVRELQTR